MHLPRLRNLLGELYSDVTSIRRVLDDAEIELTRIDFASGRVDNIWYSALQEAEKSDKLKQLIAVVIQEYPNNQAIRDLTKQLATNEPSAGQQHRVWIIGVAATVALVGLLGFGIYHADWSPWHQAKRATIAQPTLCTTLQPCLLIADFAPMGDELADEITRKTRATLMDSSRFQDASVQVMPAGLITSTVDAQQLVGRERAQVLVWGELFHNFQELTIHVALTDQLGIDEDRAIRPYRIHRFDDVTQQIRCSGTCFTDLNSVSALIDQLSSVIAYTATGLVYYANDQPEAASTAFGQALACAGEDFATKQENGENAESVVDTDWVAPPSTSPGSALSSTSCPLQQALLQSIDGLDPTALYYYSGQANILTGDYRTAIDLLQRAVEHNSQDPAPHIALAIAYQNWLDQDDAPKALDALTTATGKVEAESNRLIAQQASATELATVMYELGLIAELRHDWQTATTHYDNAVAKFGIDNPDAYIAMVALGRVQRLTGNIRAAEQTLQNATRLDEHVPWAWLELAQLHAGTSAAELDLVQARAAAPNQAYVDIIEAELCNSWAAFPACAQKAYEQALIKRPQSGWLYDLVGTFYQLGEPHLDYQSWEKAAEYFRQAVALRPHSPWTQERLAFALFQTEAYGDAAEHFALSLALSHPNTVSTARICMLGQAQMEASLNEKAIANLQLCLGGIEDVNQRSMVEGWLNEVKTRMD